MGFGIGPMELVIIGIIALLLFGKRLPEVARGMGRSITEFKRGLAGIPEQTSPAVQARPLPRDVA